MGVKELTVEAKTENLSQVLAFLEERLEELECPMKAQMQIEMALEEMFVNVASYAYKRDPNAVYPSELVSIRVEDSEDPRCVAVTLTDCGMPFDPLKQKEPDITLSAQERQIGGLGIFLVRKSMDQVDYEYKDGQNVLTFRKHF